MIYEVLLSFITAFIPSYFIIPSVIHVAKAKHLYDVPGERRSHTEVTPSLGGVAIFAGVMFSMIFWTPFKTFSELQYTLCSFIIIFLIGVKDDIMDISPYKKLLGEVMAAGIVVFKSGVKITSLHGLAGIYAIPNWFSIILTTFIIIVIINAFNLIDGINGLSGSISTLIGLTLGTWFYLVDKTGYAIMAFSLAGAVVAFLKYNYTPARIFMGDTGALLLGLILSILIINFIEINQQIMDSKEPLLAKAYTVAAGPGVAIGILILPLFDTLRVFILRMSKGRSPFSPDRTHIHHLLIDFGFTHMQATGILVTVSALFTVFSLACRSVGTFPLIFLILLVATVMTFMLQKSVERKRLKLN